MKSGNYDELMDKFYGGKASAEEILLLKTEGLLDEQDIVYAEALNTEREQKMDWEFEDFLNELPATKVVALPAHRIWVKRMMAAAAIIVVILTAYVFWPQQNQPKEIASVPVIHESVDSNQELMAKSVLPADKIKYTAQSEEKVKPETRKNRNYAVQTRQQRPVKSIRNKAQANENVETKTNVEDFLVIVNGKPITNEAEAIAITRESLGMFSRNLTTTIDKLKPISQIKIRL